MGKSTNMYHNRNNTQIRFCFFCFCFCLYGGTAPNEVAARPLPFCKGRDASSSRPGCTLPGAIHHKNIHGVTRPNCDHQTDHQPIADTGRTTERTSGAALAGFYRKGRAACSRSNFLHRRITWNRPPMDFSRTIRLAISTHLSIIIISHL